MSSSIKFDRTPYTIKYHDRHGEVQSIKRRPPKRLHNMLPTDKVELTGKKNDDWDAGGIYTVKHINPRHPNVIQITKENGESTFVSSRDLKLDSKISSIDGVDKRDHPVSSKYLTWP